MKEMVGTSEGLYILIGGEPTGANNGQIGDLNPFGVCIRLLYIENLIECMN